MFDQPQRAEASYAALSEVASAPGELPARHIEEREAALAGQFRHDNTTVPLSPQAGERTIVEATSGELFKIARTALYYTTDGTLPNMDSSAVELSAAESDWSLRAGFLTRWRAEIPAQPAGTWVRYRIAGWLLRRHTNAGPGPDLWAHDGQGFWFRFADGRGISTFSYNCEPAGTALPAWAADAVIYQVFVDRFAAGAGALPRGAAGVDTLHGGDLAGVEDALPYLRDLGINCLWLSPINAASSYHRYDPTDFYQVDPALGGDAAMRSLVAAAHAGEMRVILDFVPSHVSWRHPAFVEAQLDRGAATSPWFTFYHWPQSYRTFLEAVPELPSLNSEDAGARRHLIGSVLHMLREFGVDGFRIDHAIGASMDFWVELRRAAAAVRPDVLLVGEVTDTPDSLRRYGGRLNGVLDFPLARALRHTFARGDWSLERLVGYLDSYERYMAAGPGRVSFLDNHDMNRFLYLAGGDTASLELAALCQFTLAGPPVVYYGTEVGMSQQQSIEGAGHGGDGVVRADMVWEAERQDGELLCFYRRLIALRRAQPVLRHGSRRTVALSPDGQAMAYRRTYTPGESLASGDMIVAFNVSEWPQRLLLPSSSRLAPQVIFTTGAQEVQSDVAAGEITLTISPRSGVVFEVVPLLS